MKIFQAAGNTQDHLHRRENLWSVLYCETLAVQNPRSMLEAG